MTETPTSWAPVDLAAVLAGEHVEQAPAILARSDGRALLYPARVHALHAEPEALKSWLALRACRELLRDYQRALFIDFEDSAANIISRLQAQGANREEIAEGFAYIRPDEPLVEPAIHDLDHALEARPALVVIDGITEAFSAQGLSPLDNADVAVWLDLLPRRIVRQTEAAVLLLDHVVKDRETRGRYAIGAQHKLAGVDVAYSLRVIEPFARGRDGQVAIRVEKDRPGRIREFAGQDGQVALMHARSREDGSVQITLDPPDDTARASFRPTGIMERISLALEADPGLSKRAIRAAVGGQTKHSDLALELLIAEKFVEVRTERQAHKHHPVCPYREAEDQPHRDYVTDRDQTVTSHDQSHGDEDRDYVTAPPRGHVTGRGHAPAHQPDRDRDYDDNDIDRWRHLADEPHNNPS